MFREWCKTGLFPRQYPPYTRKPKYSNVSYIRSVTTQSMFLAWYSMKEIMEYLGVSRDTVLDWIERREMPAAKIGRLWKFKISEVDAWMKSGVAADK